jgi:hypothetical protein
MAPGIVVVLLVAGYDLSAGKEALTEANPAIGWLFSGDPGSAGKFVESLFPRRWALFNLDSEVELQYRLISCGIFY